MATTPQQWVHPAVAAARDLREQEREALAEALRARIEGDVLTGRADRLLYANDASIFQMEPAAVVYPRSAEDIAAIVRLCADRRIAVLPRGGGTSLAGQAINHAVVIDCSRYMDRVLEIDVERRTARVQPGVVVASLNREAARHGLAYAIDPSTANRATLGGGIGNNSCGAHSVIYGKTSDQLLSLEVVLADGSRATLEAVEGSALVEKLAQPDLEGTLYRETLRLAREHASAIDERYPPIQRRVSGYNLDGFTPAVTGGGTRVDLAQMVVGSEGTLALITEATVQLVPLPRFKGIASAQFPTVIAAAEATLVALTLKPAAVEMVDSRIIQACRARSGFAALASFVDGDPGGLLLIEFFGESAEEVQGRLDDALAVMRTQGRASHVFTTTDAAQQTSMWRMREAGLGLLMSVRGDAKPMALVEDTAVAPERLPAYLARFEEIVARYGTEAGYYGHASVGCLHIRPLVNPKSHAGLRDMQALASDVADLVLEFGGSLSGEHGDGILRGVFTKRMFGAELTAAFVGLKRAWDPQGILNPGKIVETPAFEDYLRVSPRTSNIDVSTHLDFTREGGFARAIEQCNGQGACRKLDGAMCPSYMVTHEEEHSTRGRANLLRMAISGVLPPEELTGDRVAAALDLCVECKACAVECPSGVDLAKLKYEVLAQRHEVHGVPLRDRAFAHIADLARLASPFAVFANALARLAPVRALLGRFGVHPERPLPRLARKPFRRWFTEHVRSQSPGGTRAPRGEIVLMDDTFTRWFHPEVGEAAVRVLEALGYRVLLAPRLGCCGRPMISKGLLGDAKDAARRNIEAVQPYVDRGVPIVGTEPSCLLTFREEYPDLLGERARGLAANAWLLDELVARLLTEEPELRALFDASKVAAEGASPLQAVALHAHCHQKAGPGLDPTAQALRGAGYEVSAIDSGCCGMAGSFGFESEHYEVSQAMGALRLFPAVEAAHGPVAITGVSCRQQIGHFTSARPRHSAELLADALKD